MYKCNILLDSVSTVGARITTFEITFPRFILAEFNTHKRFSRNAASTRAIPTKKILSKVWNEPFIPEVWGKNIAGMQAKEELNGFKKFLARNTWILASKFACIFAWMLTKLGLHKQLAGRIIEPWAWTTVIVTATEWSNFFALRNHPDAQPEFKIIAGMMQEQYDFNTAQITGTAGIKIFGGVYQELKVGEWHLPLLPDRGQLENEGYKLQDLIEISVGRCARVSYLTHSGIRDPMQDIQLCKKLQASGHMCYDDQTEVLTDSGWKLWKDLTEVDELAAIDIKSKNIIFEKPINLYNYRYDGDLYKLEGISVDLAVTPNHNMVVSYRKSGNIWSDYRLESATDIGTKPRRYLKAGTYAGNRDKCLYYLPMESSKEFFKLLGFFVGDGYASSTNQIQFRLKKERKIKFLYSLGYTVQKLQNNKYAINASNLGKWFRSHCYDPSGNKLIPTWIIHESIEIRNSLLIGLKNSDGSIKRKTWQYCSTSKQVMDILQILLHLNNLSGNLYDSYVTHKDGRRSWFGKIIVSNRNTPRVELEQTGRSHTYNLGYYPYSGQVYCATVSTGAIIVRRGGKVIVSGNSPFEHLAQASSSKTKVSGNFIGWNQYRKRLPNEDDFLKVLLK